MELSGKVAVVTGAGSGIGRALARRFVADGARGLVAADLNAAGVEALAAELGDAVLAVPGDVTDDGHVGELLARAQDAFGPIDLFCANAGIGTGSGLDAPDDVWRATWAVNVHAHVIAARRLVPQWLERGQGYWMSTASAAGLLTQIGDAPYSVTKHAAVAFAEWLAVTYGSRGLRVSCLCPMGVNTAMLQTGLDQAGSEGLGVRVVAAAGTVLEPEDVADVVVDALREERFLVLPHPEVLEFLRRKTSDTDRWIAGMQRLQESVLGAG